MPAVRLGRCWRQCSKRAANWVSACSACASVRVVMCTSMSLQGMYKMTVGTQCSDVTQAHRNYTNQRHWIEQMFRLLKHLLATEACQARTEDAYYGHLVLRLMAGFVLFYTSRVIFKGHVTMEEIVFTLKHHWMTVDYEPFELYGIA